MDEQPPEPVEHEETGLDLARAIARGLIGKTGVPGVDRPRFTGSRRPLIAPRASGAHADDRDPQTLDLTMSRLVQERGWETDLRVQGVFARWGAVVGTEVARHAQPESYADGVVVCRTDSTAWATQLRLLAPDLVRRLNEVLGDGTVRLIEVRAPHAPSWGKGRYRVKGRGPRDTYG